MGNNFSSWAGRAAGGLMLMASVSTWRTNWSSSITVEIMHSLYQYLIFQQVSSFGTGRVWTANCSFKALFNQKLHILLQALKKKKKQTDRQHWPSSLVKWGRKDNKKKNTKKNMSKNICLTVSFYPSAVSEEDAGAWGQTTLATSCRWKWISSKYELDISHRRPKQEFKRLLKLHASFWCGNKWLIQGLPHYQVHGEVMHVNVHDFFRIKTF